MRTRRGSLMVACAALVTAVVSVVLAVVLVDRASPPSGPASVTVGEAIYRTGVFDGRPIPRTGTSGGMMGGSGMGGGMMAAGCANCHGLDGRGRATQTFTAPDITYANLTSPPGMLQPDGSRGPTYADTDILEAVTEGIDPEGNKLAQPMPQWQLTDQEWADLLAYLKTLH